MFAHSVGPTLKILFLFLFPVLDRGLVEFLLIIQKVWQMHEDKVSTIVMILVSQLQQNSEPQMDDPKKLAKHNKKPHTTSFPTMYNIMGLKIKQVSLKVSFLLKKCYAMLFFCNVMIFILTALLEVFSVMSWR